MGARPRAADMAGQLKKTTPEKWRGKNWLPWVGALLFLLSLGAMAAIWNNVMDLEKKRCQEHENLAQNIGETAKTFILSQQYDYFSEVLKLLKQISFIDFISVSLGGRTALQVGDASHPAKHRYLVRQKLDYQGDKQAEMLVAFSLDEFQQPKQNIMAAFSLIAVLLLLLCVLGLVLYRTHQKLLKAESTKEDMIYSITHDAKQDLQVIQGKLSAIIPHVQASFKNAKLERDLKLTQESADSINRYLDNLKDQQWLGKGKIEILPEACRLDLLVESVAEAFVEKLNMRSMQVKMGALERTLWTWADPLVTKRILMNLIHNAMKYSPSGGLIYIWQEIQGSEIRTYVQDQGQGIAPKDWQQIFQPYVQLDSKKEGMGLGLATARKLVELMGGRLEVFASSVGRGTTMVFALPVRQDKERSSKE